jgi:hypothetical protein
MFNAARDDDKFPFVDNGFVAAKLHPQFAFHHQKKLVFVVMMMPDKVALELDGFEIAIIDFGYDARIPVVRALAEFLF